MYAANEDGASVRALAAKLYREQRSYLMALARRNAAGEADAQEALQEAFVAFIAHFDPDRGAPPLAWLTLTLKRECWAKRRKAHLERCAGQEAAPGGEEQGTSLAAIPSTASGPEGRVAEREDAKARLARLKPDERTAVTLQAAGYSYAEIGEHRGWTQTKVNRCLAEGRARLRAGSAPM